MRAILLALVLLVTQQAVALNAPAAKQVEAYSKKNLAASGVIRQQGNFVYVDVDDRYVHKLLPFIKKYGYVTPPYFGKPGLVGAHISLIDASDVQKYGIVVKEIGKRVNFKIKKATVEKPPLWKTVDRVYFIEVHCPYLTKLRAKYGLPKRTHQYHITVGIKPKA